MSTLHVNGFEMHYQSLTHMLPKDAVFIHGNLGSNSWWKKVVAELSGRNNFPKRGHMVMAEWRGCGASGAPTQREELAIDQLARDYAVLIEELNLEKPVVVGHSTGGAIALLLAKLRPDLVSHLVLLDPIAADGVQFSDENIAAFKMMQEDRKFCEMIMAMTIHHCDTKDPLFIDIVDQVMATAERVWTDMPKILSRGVFDITHDVLALTVPVTLIHGKEDGILPVEGSRQLSRLLPNCQYFEIEDHGHSLNVEDPKLFIDLMLKAFL